MIHQMATASDAAASGDGAARGGGGRGEGGSGGGREEGRAGGGPSLAIKLCLFYKQPRVKSRPCNLGLRVRPEMHTMTGDLSRGSRPCSLCPEVIVVMPPGSPG